YRPRAEPAYHQSWLGVGRTGTHRGSGWTSCLGPESFLEPPRRQRHHSPFVDPTSSRGECERCCRHRKAQGMAACVNGTSWEPNAFVGASFGLSPGAWSAADTPWTDACRRAARHGRDGPLLGERRWLAATTHTGPPPSPP